MYAINFARDICMNYETTFTCVFSNGICCFFLKECNHDVGVQLKACNTHQDEQGGVGHDADEWVIADGNQGGKDCAKDDPGVNGILPVVGAFKAHYELK